MARTMTVDVGDELREFIDSVKAGDPPERGHARASLREAG
jgi:hypothetical protein